MVYDRSKLTEVQLCILDIRYQVKQQGDVLNEYKWYAL